MTSNYGARLFPKHQKLLADSAISVDVARDRGYVTADTKAQLERYGFGTKQCNVPALVVPVWSVTGKIAFHQARPDNPRVTDAGKTVKYETPAKTRMVVDVHPHIRDRMGDPAVPLWITEGIRKADSAISHGLVCVALLGVNCWRGTNGSGGKTALPDWHDIALNDRQVFVCFDSDVMTKPAVSKALRTFKTWLEMRKANVQLVYLPDGPDGTKQGLDDYLAAGGSIKYLQ